VIAVASAALHRAAPSALVSRPIFGPTATASDNRAGHAGMAPRSPGSATSLLRHWPRAIADTSERAASAGIRSSHRSLVEPQFLDLPRIRRYTANSGEDFLLNSSGHGARPTSFAATFLLQNQGPSRSDAVDSAFLHCLATGNLSSTATRPRSSPPPQPPRRSTGARAIHPTVPRAIKTIRTGSFLPNKGGSISESA
jgi:hypothetical protein